ncbi:MAG: plasmid partition protein ParG [Rhizonema sp. NSF051]|nr:plasmid partition protein ParG [Rhizonema sp. NSF051]
MHVSITNDIKRRFHAACAMRGLKMSQVVVELIEQWLRTNDVSTSGVKEGEFVKTSKVTKSS